MLTDSTNALRPPVFKTFQRRAKEPAAADAGELPARPDGVFTPSQSDDSYGASQDLSKKADSWSGNACRPRSGAVARCPGGLLQNLRDRRASVLLPFSTALEAVNRRKRDGSRKEREHRLAIQARVAELVARFEEIDAFELAVEDPGPSPEPVRHRRNPSYRGAASGGAHVPWSRGVPRAQVPPLAARAVSDAARGAMQAPAAVENWKPLTSVNETGPGWQLACATAEGAPPEARSTLSSAAGLPCCAGSASGGQRPGDLQHGSVNLMPDDVAVLVQDVCRLGISGSVEDGISNGSAVCSATMGGRKTTRISAEPCGRYSSQLLQPAQQDVAQARVQLPGLHHGGASWCAAECERREVAGTSDTPCILKATGSLPNTVSARRGSRARTASLPLEKVLDVDDVGAASAAPEPVLCSGDNAASLPSTVSVRRSRRRVPSLLPQAEQSCGVPFTESTPCTLSNGAVAAPIARVTRASFHKQSRGEGLPENLPEAQPHLATAERLRPRTRSWTADFACEPRQVAAVQAQVCEVGRQELADEQYGTELPYVPGTGTAELEQDAGCAGEVKGDLIRDAQGQQVQEQQQQRVIQQSHPDGDRSEGDAQSSADHIPAWSESAALISGRGSGAAMVALEKPMSLAACVPLTSSAACTPHSLAAHDIAAWPADAVTDAVEAPSVELGPAGSADAAAADTYGGELPEAAAPLQGPEEAAGRRSSVGPTLTPLQRLLQLCGQKPSLERHELPTMDEVIDQLLKASVNAAGGQEGTSTAAAAGASAKGRGGAAGRGRGAATKRPTLAKVGEGSYGEAWRLGSEDAASGGGGMVIKVVPIEGDMIFNDGPQKTASDMLSETLMCRELSALADGGPPGNGVTTSVHWTAGFVRMHAVAVCRGPYSRGLVKAWERWDEEHGSENEPVSSLPRDQLYWIIAMENSGLDLEKYVLDNWDQLRSVLLQTGLSLAVAEAALQFEHRDLHWGNVLVRPVDRRPDLLPGGWLVARLRGHNVRVASCGVGVTIIDFTQSRLVAPDGSLAFCDLSQDPAVFEGTKGEVQFDTYRWMRRLLEDDWSSSCLATNCLWLSYMAEVLSKRFGCTVSGRGLRLTSAHKRQLREFRRRAAGYSSCSELVWDELFQGLIQVDG